MTALMRKFFWGRFGAADPFPELPAEPGGPCKPVSRNSHLRQPGAVHHHEVRTYARSIAEVFWHQMRP